MSIQLKTSLVLFLLGVVGVLSLLFSSLATSLPPEITAQFSETALKFLILVNPILFLAVAVALGAVLAKKVGLAAPLIENTVRGLPIQSILAKQVKWGILLGIASGAALVIGEYLVLPSLPQAFIEKSREITLSPLTRFLYGGITEEILLRWGIMTLIVWLLWKLFNRKSETPTPTIYWIGVIGSALVFGAGHLPVVFSVVANPSSLLIVYIILANALFGLIAGWLFWRHGLEAAMIAHIFAHIVMVVFG